MSKDGSVVSINLTDAMPSHSYDLSRPFVVSVFPKQRAA